MFDYQECGVGLLPGERFEDLEAEDQLSYEMSCLVLADGWTSVDRHLLPDDLEQIPPGPYLAAVVSTVDPSRLNGHDVVRLMQAEARLSSHHEAGKLAAMSEVGLSPPGDADSPVERGLQEVEYAAVEVAAALPLTRRSSEVELNRAISLTGRLHRVLQAFSRGEIDLAKVGVFDQQLGHLPDETVDGVLDRVLGQASGLTTGQLRARVARLVLETDPDGAKSSFREGLEERKVCTYANPDLTGNFIISSADPAALAAARQHVEKMARHVRSIDDTGRTLDQIRADVALDLLSGKCGHYRHANRVGGRTNVTVSVETLARLSDQPGELDGYGPVFAEMARKTVRENIDGEWVFTVMDNGTPVATGSLARRPTASQRRRVEADYPTCVMVGCRQPAHDCDLDHRKPVCEGGPTHNHNLGPLCRHHHMVKHHSRWRVRRLHNGDHQWTSPLGHSYTRKRDPPE